MKKNILNILLLLVVVGMSVVSCEKVKHAVAEDDPQTFLFLYTNDEHGHIWEKGGYYKSVALHEMWAEEEKKCPGCIVYRLSGGDSYTGSAVSSIFKGESTAEIMRELRYQVSAVGNHEFDYGLLPFENNRKVSEMDYVSANIFGLDLKPVFKTSTVIDRGNSKIGFIGVTTEELKQVSFAPHLKDMRVVRSLSAVNREMKKLAGKSDMQVIIAHQSFANSKEWVFQLDKKPLIVFNGHEHDEYVKNVDDILFVQAKKYFRKYARVEVLRKKGRFYIVNAEIIPIKKKCEFNDEKGKRIKKIVDRYLRKVEKVAGTMISNAASDFSVTSFQKLYTCSLLEEFPDVDTAMCNPGAFRDKIQFGVVKKSDIISMLPFENRLVVSKIKGKHLKYNLDLSGQAYCGVRKKGKSWFIKGKEVEDETYYTTVVHEYIYNGGDHYRFINEETENSITTREWRRPLIKYLIKEASKGLTIEESWSKLRKKYRR